MSETKRSPEVDAAEAGKLRAEAKLAEAQTRKELAAAESAEIDLAKKVEEYEEKRADNKYHRIYVFSSTVSDTTVATCIKQLDVWKRQSKEPIEIIFNSPGGDVTSGLALFDYLLAMRREGIKLTTTAMGMAASMAGILLQAGDVRRMGKEAWVLIHEASFTTGGSFGDVEDRVKWIERIQDRILDMFAERSLASKAPKPLTKQQFRRRWHRKDWWLSSDECLEHGIVDELV
jgi:ATP-dependent Clp protease protease subunit